MNLPSHLTKRMPMSSAQRRLYLQCQLPGGDLAYHLLFLARIKGHFSLAGAQAFASQMLARHESLRSTFCMDQGDFIAEVHKEVNFAFTVIDGKEADLDAIVSAYDQPFDLTIPPLLRIVILRLSEVDCILVFNCHHLIFDGYSSNILGREIFDALSGKEPAPSERNYGDFVDWENRFFQSKAYEEQRDYWCRQYRQAPKRLAFEPDFTPPVSKSFEGDYFICSLQSKEIKAFSRSQGATLFMTLLAAFYAVLYRLTHQEEITIGTLVSPRESGNFQNIIGLFANTLPLTQCLNARSSFSALLQQVKTSIFQAMQHADFPFEHLIRQLPFLEKGVRNPLFDVVFNFERVVRKRVESFRDVTMEPMDYYSKVSMFDFAIDIVAYEDQVRFKVEYATRLFRKESLQGLMDAYFAIIKQVCHQPEVRIGELRLLSEDAHQRLLQWNDTSRTLKKGRTFLDIWQQQLGQHADNPALRFNGHELSYRQLEERANRLAHYLINSKISAGSVVAVALERSPEWVIALLAIWKAGAVYLPLAASHPQKRIKHQLTDSKAALLITTDHLRHNFADFPPVITPETIASALIPFPKNEPDQETHKQRAAYIIYTSGSTGTPKGVIVDHSALYAHIDAVKGTYKLQPDDNVLQFSSPSFDASLEQILITLASGACLVLLDEQHKDPRSLLDLLVSEEISVAEFPPAFLREILPLLTPFSFQKIRRLVSGGDLLNASLAGEVTKHLAADALLLNFYGPTEATMAAVVYPVTDNLERYDSWMSVPIGRPLANTRIYILDSHNHLLPPGVSGELCIAGDRLALGYLNQEALTEEKFIQTELLGTTERIYKTGDRARWLQEGNIEFLGRLDNQVQLRGYRIELGEIEQALHRHPEVADAAVIMRGDDRQNLVAFVVSRRPGTLNLQGLYQWLQGYLPEYMIPATFTFIGAIPRNAAGKVDRQALPDSIDSAPVENHQTPQDLFEWDLWGIWRKILKLPHIGRNDIFFQIGGNSLSAIQVMVEVKNRYNRDVPLSLLLQAPTIANLADFLRNSEDPVAPSCVVTLNPEGTRPPIILIPGLGGNILDLYELSTHLDKRFPCYGLQHNWETDPSSLSNSMESLAGYYLDDLGAKITLESCILVGHSFGGYVAYEVARILENRGQAPQALLLLDVVAPQRWTGESSSALDEHELMQLTIKSLMGERDAVVEKTTAISGTFQDEYEKTLHLLQSANRIPRTLPLTQFKLHLQRIAKRAAALTRYAPDSLLATDISLYRAEEEDESPEFSETKGTWADFTHGSFSVQWVPGNHFTMIKGRHAPELAKRIQCHIVETEG